MLTASATKGEYFTEADLVIRATNGLSVGVCDPECRDQIQIPKEYYLEQNYPNPFNPSTTLRYGLVEPAAVELKIFSMLGQEVVVLESATKEPGEYISVWNGKDKQGRSVPGGIYFYTLRTTPLSHGKAFMQTRKMILTK